MSEIANRPLRILGVVDLPWDSRLGAARVWVELSEQWKKAGHVFEKFCLTDAFPKPTRSRPLSAIRRLIFPFRAARYIRQNSSRFDVIDSLIGTLPFSKKRLGFARLLVGRSVGLFQPYQDFIRLSRKRWPDQPRGKLAGRFFYDLIMFCHGRNAGRALRFCDLINLLNEEERSFVQHPRVIVQPNGLTDSERAEFSAAIEPAQIRLKQKQVVFIGMWSLRKGSRDWPKIIREIRKSIPEAQFNFFGTMVDQATVLRDLQLSEANGVRCIQTYDRGQLSALLGPCAVGLFPSYVEGFGIAVLEQLACGIPTIAYDIPGPRQIFGNNAPTYLVPTGDIEAMAARAVEILRLDPKDYAALSEHCRTIADRFRWERIAAETARQYADALDELKLKAAPRNTQAAAA